MCVLIAFQDVAHILMSFPAFIVLLVITNNASDDFFVGNAIILKYTVGIL